MISVYQMCTAIYGILFLVMLVMCIFLLSDKDRKARSSSYHPFLAHCVSLLVYLYAEIAIYFHLELGVSSRWMLLLYVIELAALYVSVIMNVYWVLDLIGEKTAVDPSLRKMTNAASIVVVPITVLLFFFNGEYLYVLIPVGVFLVECIVVTLYYRRALGTKETLLLSIRYAVLLFSMYQPWFAYVPADIVTVIGQLAIYLYVWQRRGYRMVRAEHDLAVKEKELAEARLRVTLAQINPHFLYNTLNTISALCVRQPKQAQKIVSDFSDYLRENLNSLDSPTPIPFEQELENVKRYVEIEKARFGDMISIGYDIGATDFALPALTVQMLTENAIKHGIRKREGHGTIIVHSYRDETGAHVTISDDGVGFDPKTIDADGGKHHGLKLVEQRLDHLCGGTVVILSTPGVGTTVTVTIPDRIQEENEPC